MNMISVVLIEPKTQGNIGFIARAMKNFGLKDLVLINPKCDLKKEALRFAKHASEIVKKAKIKKKSYLKEFDYLIGTTAIVSTGYNIPRSPLTPPQLAEKLSKLKKTKIALIFGRESSGLNNKEIQMCDFIVTIPASPKYATMNISHSAAIIFYELFNKSSRKTTIDNITPASKVDKQVTLKLIKKICNEMEFSTADKKQTQLTLWKKIIGKSFLTKREIFALIGFLKKFKK